MSPEELRAVELLRTTPYGRISSSMRALPFLAVARHIVADGAGGPDGAAAGPPPLILRLHRGFGYHQACEGTVVAYGTDSLGNPAGPDGLWSVQMVGTCETVTPTPDQLEQLGPVPELVDGERFDPVHLLVSPQFIDVHRVHGGYERTFRVG